MLRQELPIVDGYRFKTGQLLNYFPEIGSLMNCTENNPWHTNMPVYQHTGLTLEALDKNIKHLKNNKEVRSYLRQTIDSNTMETLVHFATLFHDTSKRETIKTLKDGTTICPGHEIKGSKKARSILSRYDISDNEIAIISDFVKFHGLLHEVTIPENVGKKEECFIISRKLPHLYPGLVLLAAADTAGTHLSVNNPQEFQQRIDFYNLLLQ